MVNFIAKKYKFILIFILLGLNTIISHKNKNYINDVNKIHDHSTSFEEKNCTHKDIYVEMFHIGSNKTVESKCNTGTWNFLWFIPVLGMTILIFFIYLIIN